MHIILLLICRSVRCLLHTFCCLARASWLLQVENCNASSTCCDGYNANSTRPYATCSLACSTVARLRPPYINNIAKRARMFYPIPTPDPGTLLLSHCRQEERLMHTFNCFLSSLFFSFCLTLPQNVVPVIPLTPLTVDNGH